MARGSSGRRGPPGKGRAARPRAPALGNDPFERGAAVRAPAPSRPVLAAPPGPGEAPVAVAPPPALQPPSVTTEGAPRRDGEATPLPAPLAGPIDRRLDGLEARLEDLAAGAGLGALQAELREALSRLLPALKARAGTFVELVRLLEPPERLDRFGMDERFAERLGPVLDFLHATWWRVQVRNAAALPARGPAVVVANHAGSIPWDTLVLRHAVRREHPAHRNLRPLLDDREASLPFFGPLAIRAGAVRASAEAADRILAAGDLVGVFPEGSAVARKSWRDRYTLARFGRGGFAKAALRSRAPIVPCAIVGSEEAAPGISRTGWVAERLGVPLLAASPGLRLAPAALVPLPSRWSVRFGEPIDLEGHGPESAGDAALVNALTERTRAAVQSMLDEDVAARIAVFL